MIPYFLIVIVRPPPVRKLASIISSISMIFDTIYGILDCPVKILLGTGNFVTRTQRPGGEEVIVRIDIIRSTAYMISTFLGRIQIPRVIEKLVSFSQCSCGHATWEEIVSSRTAWSIPVYPPSIIALLSYEVVKPFSCPLLIYTLACNTVCIHVT